MHFPQILAMLVHGSGLVPARCNTRVVLPRVEKGQVQLALPINRFQREVLIKLRDVATVGRRSRMWLGLICQLTSVERLIWKLVCDLAVLGHGRILRQRGPQRAVCAISHRPDRARARGRACQKALRRIKT